jgi:two-component system, NtrC family, sensor kinase
VAQMSATDGEAIDSLESIRELKLATLESLDDGIWICELDGALLYRNAAATAMETMYWSRGGHVGTLEDVVFNAELLQELRERGRWTEEYHLSSEGVHSAPISSVAMEMQLITDGNDHALGLTFHARDVSREWWREQTLQDRNVELEQANEHLKTTQKQLLQSEKMASIGQLAAGVAHEINNPIAYVQSNLGSLQIYVRGLLNLLDGYDQLVSGGVGTQLSDLGAIDEIKRRIDYTFLREDLPQLMAESHEGIDRVRKIVLDLRDFSHAGQSELEQWVLADMHRGLESVLNIIWSEIKYKAEVRKEFGPLPLIECLPSQLNQVFLNLLINAGQAIEEHGTITITTSCSDSEICIAIADTGVGIAPEHLQRIYDPFFTTKPVGKGTGLGLGLSYGIVQKHHGRIEVVSQLGYGARFCVYLPISQRES